MTDGLYALDGDVGSTGAIGIIEAPRFGPDGWGAVAVGDITGDGRPEGALALYCHWGGSGSESRAVVYSDGPTILGEVPIGGAVGLRIVDGMLDVVGLTNDGADPNCCPSVVESRRFRVDGGGLVEAERDLLDPADAIGEGTWGPLTFGTSYADAALALGARLDVSDSMGGASMDFTPQGPSCVDAITQDEAGISFLGSSHRIGVAYLHEPGATTQAGVGVGSAEAEIRAAYGDQMREEENIYQAIPDLYVGGDPAVDGSAGIRFVLDELSRTTYLVLVGVQPYLGLPEGCA